MHTDAPHPSDSSADCEGLFKLCTQTPHIGTIFRVTSIVERSQHLDDDANRIFNCFTWKTLESWKVVKIVVNLLKSCEICKSWFFAF